MSHLEADRALASELQAQIEDLERALSALRAEKAVVQDRLDSYKYPVLTLPNELVSEIFIHFLPPYPDCSPMIGVLSPTNLTQICREWREIALATPMLWNAIDLTSHSVPSRSNAFLGLEVRAIPDLDQFDTWLSRSGCCPISLTIGGELGFSLAQSARWETLRVSLRRPPFPMIATAMPALRHLDIAIDHSGVRSEPTIFGEAPLLRSVVLNDHASTMVILPWAQLTSLHLKRVYPSECVPVLQQTPNLIHCHLSVVPDIEDAWPAVTLLQLESLVLLPEISADDDWDPEIAPGYLDTLVVPALRRLQIAEIKDAIACLTSFLTKPGCDPREILISGDRSISASAYRRAFPSIQLSFDEPYVGDGQDYQTIDPGSADVL
ncbi:hypothetical protein C8R46DRAFT_495856 [Mycena filopes]|nr:hypothetical protein C8R46DRAFT_495856 [Mycena filopes]